MSDNLTALYNRVKSGQRETTQDRSIAQRQNSTIGLKDGSTTKRRPNRT